MKQVNENSSDREILYEMLKEIRNINKKLPDKDGPTLASIGFITNDQLMAMFNIKRGKATQLRNSGALRYSKLKGLIIYKVADVVDMLNEHFVRA